MGTRICPVSQEDLGGEKEEECLPRVSDSRFADVKAATNTQGSEKFKTNLLWILGVICLIAALIMSAYSLSLSHRNSIALQQQAQTQPSTQNKGVFQAIKEIGLLEEEVKKLRFHLLLVNKTLNANKEFLDAKIEILLEVQQQMNVSVVDNGLLMKHKLPSLEERLTNTDDALDQEIKALKNKLQLLTDGLSGHSHRAPTSTIPTTVRREALTTIQPAAYTGNGQRNGVAMKMVNKLLLSCGCIFAIMIRS